MSRRWERKVHRNRAKPRKPPTFRLASVTDEASALTALSECDCGYTVSRDLDGLVVVQLHEHGCPALYRRIRKVTR